MPSYAGEKRVQNGSDGRGGSAVKRRQSRLRRSMIKAASMPASSEVPAKLSHRPVRCSGHSAAISSTGKISAVEREISVAAPARSMANMKLCVAKENQRVR